MSTNNSTTPTPGSDEAVALGCICARIDNGRGRGYMGQPGVFIYTHGCRVHDSVLWKPTPEELATLRRFVGIVNARAEGNMLKTHKLEGAHHNAMKAIMAELDPKTSTVENPSPRTP